MIARRLITLVTLAALGFASAELPAQERERRRDRSREEQQQPQQPQQPPSTRPAPPGYNERYAVIEQRNVFMKDRSRPARRLTLSATQPTRRSPEESLVVRGIAMEDIGYRAYVEDLNTGATLRLSPGDALGPGRVSAIALDAIAYERDGRQTWIEIGNDLTGKFSTASVSASGLATTSPTTPTTLPANVDLNDPNLTVEQRMRLRVQLRKQRMGE